MKTILRHVQIALAGEGKDGRVISADMLRNIASNFNGNHYPQILKKSPLKSQICELIGYVTQLYLVESTLGLALYGHLEFTEYYDMATLKDTLDNRVYIAIEVTPVQPGYESLYRIWFTDGKFTEQQQPVNFRKCKCIGRKEQAQKTLEPEIAASFSKKYDYKNSGYVGTITPKSDNKIHFNESDTFEIEKGYLIVNTKDTVTAVKISEIEAIDSIKNKDKTESIYIRTSFRTRAEMSNSNISARDLIEILDQYKESQLVALKAS
ncbi:hypothetical protein PG39_19850 [Salmonella enterica subsp. diarizonae]|uniref:Uncharacterized protein n=1 Tax=Salmonella diarizonae TaxID=59204 RepID=A0A5U3D393_SALDZ|nr:hypothetical protein [Salmonella enterica subsp. diarizonae]ECO1716913.1 hypothetical protein [Salmonella enterica]EBP3695421.1 hypothetical protein [Salmonella enterica subsp. diarizonae]EBQ6945762.1 hypothetical protein [Salmonella enterica subsp. diarizonae]ECO1823511.1 hypothetical protein [Salmonella enterica]